MLCRQTVTRRTVTGRKVIRPTVTRRKVTRRNVIRRNVTEPLGDRECKIFTTEDPSFLPKLVQYNLLS